MNAYTYRIVSLAPGSVGDELAAAHTVMARCLTAAWLKALNDYSGPRACRAILTDYVAAAPAARRAA